MEKIDVGSYADAKTLDPYQYGLGISVAKIYITFMEMKLFLIMWFRKFIINALILVAPIAIALKEAEPEFVSTETWLTLAIKYMFLPVYYGICFLVAVIFIGNLSEKNALSDVIVYSFIFKGANILTGIFALKMANKDGNSTPGLNVIGAVMALRTIGSVIKGGIKGAAGMPGKVARQMNQDKN